MFDSYTDRARRVVVLAQEEARLLGHHYIGTEHLLLGMIHEGEGVAAKALAALGIELQAVRSAVLVEIVERGISPTSPGGPSHLPFTPRCKKVLELALREALQLGHNYVGTEHILLGLIREGEGIAAAVLVKLGAELSRVRQQVITVLSGYTGPVTSTTAQTAAYTATISSFNAEMAERARLFGTEREQQMVDAPAAARSLGDFFRRVADVGLERAMSEPMTGVWLAYYSDWSSWAVFAEEIDALRHAVENAMSVKFLEFGASPRAD